jgi:hypothetical protein
MGRMEEGVRGNTGSSESMISYLKNGDIDRVRWDASLKEIPFVKPYALSWYLDIMSPGWEALVDDDYMSVFPLTCRRKYGFSYLATPVFLQQLGLFTADGDRKMIAEEFISFMPEFFRLVDLCIGQEAVVPGYSLTPRYNYELRLTDQYEKAWVGYMSDCRRNINIARRYPQEITADVRPQELISLYRAFTAGKARTISQKSYSRLNTLMQHCITTGTGKIYGVRSPRGKLLWGMFVIDVHDRMTMLFTAGSRKSRELRTSYLVIDHLIRTNSGTGKVIDFAGSSVPSIALFMKSFGGVKTVYWRLYRNTLPWPVRMFK